MFKNTYVRIFAKGCFWLNKKSWKIMFSHFSSIWGTYKYTAYNTRYSNNRSKVGWGRFSIEEWDYQRIQNILQKWSRGGALWRYWWCNSIPKIIEWIICKYVVQHFYGSYTSVGDGVRSSYKMLKTLLQSEPRM